MIHYQASVMCLESTNTTAPEAEKTKTASTTTATPATQATKEAAKGVLEDANIDPEYNVTGSHDEAKVLYRLLITSQNI
jgi:hypothetical protein